MKNPNQINSMLQEPKKNIIFPLIFMSLSIIASLFCLYKTSLSQTFLETFYVLIITTTFFIIVEIVKRITYFSDGLIKICSEHEGNFTSVTKAAFLFNNPSTMIIVYCVIFFVALIINLYNGATSFSFLEYKNQKLLLDKVTFPVIAFFSGFCFSYLLLNFIKLSECRAQKLEAFYDLGGLDYGSSMACSYFFGYLKIILPPDGKENEGLAGRIENFEGKHDVSVPVKKLFILIPASFYTPPDLKDSSNNWLEVIPTDLKYDVLPLNRAGVHKRQYQNTIYKLIPDGLGSGKNNSVHVVTEGATPLLTFFEVQQQSHRYSNTYREFKKEIGKSFYRTLQNLLNDNPDCRDLCELVYYEDYDANGKKVNVAEILLQRINQLSADE